VIRSHRLDSSWREHIDPIPEEALGSLETCSDALSRHYNEKSINETQLKELHTDVQGLLTDVIAAEIAPGLKEYMLKHLDMIERAIQDYQFLGAEPLATAFESAMGSVFISKKVATEAADTPLGKRFWDILAKLAMVVTITVGVPQLPGRVGQLLSKAQDYQAAPSDENHGGIAELEQEESDAEEETPEDQ